jgi:hypothetical protein
MWILSMPGKSEIQSRPLTAGIALRVVLGFALIGLVSACQRLNPMVPERASSSTVSTQVSDFNTSADTAQRGYGEAKSDSERTRLRDEVVANKILAYDVIFEDFAWNAWTADSGVATLSDWVVLGLTAAGSVATGGTTQVLSATAAAVTGAKTALQKNFLYSKTIDQLIFAMTVNRTQIRTHIQTCLGYPDSQYSLNLALIELEQYKQAAILPLAIANLTTSPTNASTQQSCASALRIGTLAQTSSVALIEAWLRPNGVLDTSHRDQLQTWMQTRAISPALRTAPVQEILKDGFETDRQAAMKALNIK